MKPILIITTVLFFLSAQADITNYNEQQVIIKDKKTNHNEWNIPADMPDVYYNYVSGIITIVDYVNATYYVTIVDDWNTVTCANTFGTC